MEENNNSSNTNKSKKIILVVVIILLLISLGILFYLKFINKTSDVIIQDEIDKISVYDIEKESLNLQNGEMQNIDTIPRDSIEEEAIRLSEDKISYTIDKEAGSSKNSVFTGKRINIAVTGLDGRIGRVSHLADANHVISILVETGEIEITSIPRDTYCDLEYDDSTGLNKLTICRSKGRKRYHQELARIARLDRIHYFVEFGFSQAMGIIEFLGFKNPDKTLQVLRNRKGLGGDDYQRCYTQGQFIRQAMLSHFNKFTGTFGGILARAGLLLVETNLTGEKAIEIIEQLEKVNFPQSPESVVVRVRPPIKIAYKVYDFNDENTVDNLIDKVEKFNKKRFENGVESPQPVVNVTERLNNIINKAISDTAKNPTRVISTLSPYFQQRAWFQIKDRKEREKIRDEFGVLLISAYTKKNKLTEAENVREIIEAEKKVFESER